MTICILIIIPSPFKGFGVGCLDKSFDVGKWVYLCKSELFMFPFWGVSLEPIATLQTRTKQLRIRLIT